MNNINELIEIIRTLDGAASIDAITAAYCKKHQMLKLPGYRMMIENSLKVFANNLVVYDNETGLWKLIQTKVNVRTEVKTVGQQPLQVPEDGELLALEGVLEGSPEWFYQQSQTNAIRKKETYLKGLRDAFIQTYSADKLDKMSGEELLTSVFAVNNSMMQKLTISAEYRNFGAGSKYAYLWPLRYSPEEDKAVIYENQKPKLITHAEALDRAESIRDNIERCLNALKAHEPFAAIEDYKAFNDDISDIPFAQYPWSLKYYQMLYPEYFPAMYASQTLNRATKILGLPQHGLRVQKMGEISLFTRKCNIDNVIFMHLFGLRWGWNENQPTCECAVSKDRK